MYSTGTESFGPMGLFGAFLGFFLMFLIKGINSCAIINTSKNYVKKNLLLILHCTIAPADESHAMVICLHTTCMPQHKSSPIQLSQPDPADIPHAPALPTMRQDTAGEEEQWRPWQS